MANTENIWDELLKKQQEQFGLGTNTQEEETLDVEVPKAVIENPVEETAGIVEDAKVDNTVVTPKAEVVTPTPKEDKIADMYAYLQKGGYDKLGTLDEFRQKMESDPEFEDEVGYNLYAVNQANELKQRDQLKEYYKGLKKQGIVKDDQQTFVNNMINDESYRQAVSDNISAYNAKVQKKIDAAKKAKVQSAQTTAPVMAENTENVNGRSEGWGQLNLTPETGLPQIIAERARKTRLENEAKTKTMAQAIEEAKLKELYDVLQGNRKTSEGLTQMSAQLRDRMDYFAITGKELKDDVLDMTQFGVAPTVVRDGNGDVLKGSVNNATRANVQRYEQERVKRENIDRQLEEAKAEEERLMKLVDEVGETTITNFPSQFGVYTNVYNTPDRSAIQASLRQVRERMDALEQEKNGGQRGFFNGLTTTLTDGSTWMFGVDKLYDTKLIYDISKKVERGEELSEYEKLLLDTMYKTQEVQSRLDENSDWLYRAGVVTGNQIPFMAQIYLTKGFGALAELGAEAGTRWAAAYAKKFGQDALVHRIMANTIKGLGVTAGDVAAGFASANTTGLANTANDALQRATGQLVKDEDGNYNFEGAEDLWRAIGKAEVSQTKEFATERFGEHIPGLRKLNVWIAKTGNTGRKLARALSGVAGSSAVRTTSKFLNKAGMQGIVPEIIEEEIGLPIDVAIGDMTWEEALSKKNQWDIVGGMLLSVGAMHGATLTAVGAGKVYNTAQYYKYKNRADKQGRVAAFRLGEDRWNEWKDKIDMTTTEDMNDLWEEVRNDNTLEVQEKRAIFDYINSLTAARAYNLGMLFQSRVAAENPELKPEAITPAEKEKISVISSEDKGYNIDQPKDMNEAKLDLDYQAQRINEILGEELANGIINSTAHVGDIIDQIIGNEKLTDEQRQVAFDYLNAKQVYNGMINRAQDDIDSRIAFNNEKIDQNSNENGIITTATLKDGSPVYVVRGDVFLDQDGNFIKANSSNSIVVRNQITGAIQMIDPSEVASIESSQPADQLKKDSAAQIRMQMAQERAAQIDGTLSFIPGDVYTMSDEQGMPLQVEVVADNGDGSVQVNYNGQPTVMPKEQLQAMNDEYNRQSAIFRNERKQANAGQKTSTQRRAEKLAKQQPVQEVEKEPTALDKVPVDENGQRHYEQAKAGDAYDALVEQLGIEGAAQVATIEKEKARKAFEAATKKIPTGNTTDEVIASARQIAQERAAAERLYAHWNAIETTPMMRENADRIAQDMIRKAKEAEQSSNSIAKEMNDLYASLQKAKDEEKQPILDKLSDLIRTFAADNGYDCEVLNSVEAFLNAPGIAHRRADYEKQIAGGIITPGYTFQGKIYINTAHCMPEGAETFYDYVEGTLVHEATHVDNKEDDRQVMFLAQAIREGSVKLEEALDIIGRLSGVNTYTEDAANMTAKGQDPAQMVADELLAHLNQERAINGAAADEFTKNDIIIKLANEVYEKRETKRNSGDRSGRSTTNNASANSTVSGSPADNAGESTDEQVRRSDRSSQKSQDEVTPEFVQQDVERMVASEGLSEETAQDLADVGLTMSGTVPMDYNALALKEETGYHTPNEVSLVDDILFSHGTAPAWAQGFLSGKPTKREQRVAEVILNWYDLAAADELTHDYMSYEVYPEGGLNKDGEGPLRENVEYVHTFDLDTTCPRTFQYLYFADEIEKRIGRPMTQNECIQLIEEMRAHGLQIPCVYCYAENKRQALKNYFNNFINFRNNVLAAKSEKAAFAAMYGHTNNDPTKPISKAAQEVLARWRDTSVEFNQYRPTIQELTTDYKDARSAILWTLDYWKKEGAISERDSDNSLIAKLCANYRIDTKKNAPKEDKGRMSSIASIVNDWRYDELEHVPHHNYDAENQANGLLSKRMRNGLTLWDEMKKYGASASSAHNAVRYIPYTNELSKITKDKKDYINGMGGLRMHSTNDFRIDYVGDYFQLIADMAKDGWFGHTYTKSPLMVEIFGNTGYRINMSCAAYDEYERDSKGNIVLEEYIDADGKKQTRKKVARVVMNEDEGFNWEVAKRLREQYPNAGPMMMTTSHAQLQFALDADWIDMIIPFHSSGLPTEVVDMRLWEDAQSVQNESFYNSDDMRAELKEMDFSDEEIEIMKAALAGKKLTKKAQQAIADNDKAGIVAAFLKKSGGASSDDVKAMFFAKHPEIMKPIMYEDGDEMKKLRPHFLPGVTRPVKKRQDIEIPGWATSTAEDPKQREKENLQNYFNLCRKYGVHPRFHGIMVKDKNGNDIPIEKHPGYIKLIKETARMDTIQEAVKFNLDEPNPNLRVRVNENGDIVADPQGIEGELTDINPKTGEHWTPLEYAFYALKEHASIGGYENYNQDINGIIPDFIKNVIEYHEKTGKERPLSWLSPTGRIAWQMQQNAVDAALKSDKELILKPIPYHEYNAKDYKDMDILASHRKVDTKSPQFKNWFGDWENDPENASKVVDENGEPLVVYHGTDNYGFNIFDTSIERNGYNIGSHFGNKGAAETRVNDFKNGDAKGSYAVYLNIKNPWETSDWYFGTDPYAIHETAKVVASHKDNPKIMKLWGRMLKYAPELENLTVDEIASGDGYMEEYLANGRLPFLGQNEPRVQDFFGAIKEIAKEAGFDGIKYWNDVEGNGYSWIAFDPNQIKSATDNNGDFDPNNPDIRFSRRYVTPEQDEEYMRAVKGGSTVVTQRMVDQVAEQAGYTVNGYHGTTNRFYVFDKNKADAEGNWGKGFYFTDNYDDVEENYANNDGPDLTGRIERLAESMELMDGYEDMDYEDRLDAARKELSEGDPRVIDAYLKMENPVKIGGEDETFFDYAENYDEETDEYEDPEGLLLEFVNSLQNVLADVGLDNVDLYPIIEAGYDGLTASELEDVARETIQNEYYADENGDPSAPGEAIRQAFQRMGFDGIIDSRVSEKFKTMSGMYAGTTHMIVFSPSQIKLADPITYDNEGNVIPLSQRFNEDNDDIRFSKRVAKADPFYSNAAKAVEGIKQEKATGDQWIAMLQKAGGLKAEEDKWLGLTDWLKEKQRMYESGQGAKDEKAKEEIRKYIEYCMGLGEPLEDSAGYAKNKIFDYPEEVEGWTQGLVDEVRKEIETGVRKDRKSKTISKQEVMDYISQNAIKVEDVKYAEGYSKAADDAMDAAVKKYGQDLNKAYSFDFDEYSEEMVSFVNDEALAAKIYNKEHDGNIPEDPDKITPEQYETLRHFGDDIVNFIMDVYNASNETKEINGTRLGYTTDGLENKREIALTVPTIEPYNAGDMLHFGDAGDGRAVAWIRFGDTKDAEGNRVLVIDEIQSKRHQDGRDQGYYVPAKKEEYQSLYKRKEELEKEAQSYWPQYKKAVEDKDEAKMKEILDRTDEIMSESAAIEDKLLSFSLPTTGVPDAPFQKSWHELAIKRMLRYAAENGYDKIAWTTGTQQSERYNLSKVLKEITTQRHNEGEEYVEVGLTTEHGVTTLNVLPDGEIDAVSGANIGISTHGTYLQDVIGKELANEMLETAVSKKANYNLENMQVGGDGMKGFYDQMLPRFMDKYGKKWGVKTGTVELDLPNEADRVMHSVDVTPEMKESVMQGQPMFSRRTKPAPKKTEDVYKLMRLGEDGKLYPLFIDAVTPIELGVWYDADSPDLSMLQDKPSGVWLVDPNTKETISYDDFYKEHPELFKGKQTKYPSVAAVNWATDNGMRFMYIEDTEKAQKRFGGENRKYWNLGINGSGAVSTFSMRPGWHAASLPSMRQIGKGADKNLRDDKFVWVKGKMSADIDYNAEAQQNPDKDIVDRIPEDGYYLKATNADKKKSQTDAIGWYVGGSFMPEKIMSDSEARGVIDQWNNEHPDNRVEYDYPRESGKEFNAETMSLEEPEVRFAKRRSDTNTLKDKVLSVFNHAVSSQKEGNIKIGTLTEEGRKFLEGMSGLSLREIVDFQLHMSDLRHIYKEHYGENEKDTGNNIPLDDNDIKNIVDVICYPDYVIYSQETKGKQRKAFTFISQAKDGTYNLVEIYSNKRGSLTTKSLYKSRKGALRHLMSLLFSPNFTSKTSGATFSDAKLRNLFRSPKLFEPNIDLDVKNIINNGSSKYDAAKGIVDNLHVNEITTFHTVEDIPEGVDKDAKGWYDPQTNTVHIVPENCIDENDAKATVLHEAVAHYGLRNIMGQENLDKFLDDLYMNNEPIRNEVNKIISQYGYDYRRATEEYCARMAEQEIPTNVWKRTKAAFKTMLRSAGLKVRLGDNEILYMLWKSKRALNGGDMFDRAADVTKQMELGTGVYYSKKAPVAKGYASAQYEREAASKLLHNREQVQDRMISLDALQNAVAEETGSPILDSENAYLAENRMHGTNKNETEYFDYNYFDPLLGAVNKLMKKAKMSYKQVTDYMMMKHGLERNTEFAMRSATEDLQAKVREQAENAERRRLGIDSMTDPDEIAKAERQVKKAGETAARTVKEQVRKQFLNDADLAALKLDYANGKIDFMEYETERRKIIERYAPGTSAYLATQGDKAGLTQITGEDDDWEQAAFDAVTAVEGKNATECQELWDRTNAATGWTLKKGRDSGRMTKENYDYVNSMFDYYVPLRSWDDTKADEVYEYMNSKRPAFNPTMKKMKGRQSRAENPIAYIGSMAATEVVLGNQNLMKQYFLRMAQAHPTDLLAVSEMWYENKGTVTAPDWQAAVPVITEDMNIDEIHAEIERFNADMQAKQQAGVAKRSRQGLQITYPATYQQQEEHMVKVSVDGKDFVVYVNGNPKAAQAINGTNKVKGSLEAGKKLNQAIGQFLTSKNPSFIPANFIRDMLAAQTQILVKESPEYIAKFYGNIFTFAKMPSLLRKYKAGKLDENNETERCFKEFMENGGETGYVAMLTSDAFKDNIDNKLKKIGGHYPTIRQAWDVFGETVEFYNRAVEDATRFTTYLTSRQSGKSIDKSIDDAKNISLNFNRGGAGGDIKTGVKFIDNIIETIMPNTSTMRNMIVFVNPAIQALQNQAKLIFNHPVRFSAVAIAYIMRGMLQDMLNQLLGGDDDEYWNIPEWVRRNNLIIRIPMTDNFLKIPLSQEFRIWHSFGESVRSVMSGHSNGNPFIDLGESLLGLLPADPTGNGGNPMVSLAPTYLQPLVQVYINENFLGYPIRKENDKYEPEFQRVTIGTPNWLAKASEGLNYLAGGDAHQKGAVESFARKHGGKWGDILVNPSVWNHLFGGYFGGPYTFGSGSIDMAYNWLTGEEVKVSKVPVLSRFVARPVERSQEGKMPEDYYELLDEADETMNHRNKWNKDADKDVEGAEDKVDQIEDSKEFERAEIIRDYKKQIEGLRKELKETDDKEEKADISEEIKELMSDMREELGELEINK